MLVTCYHISRRKHREAIIQNGLLPAQGRLFKHEPRLFFSDHKDHLGYDFVDYENVDCWQFKLESSQMKRDELSGNPHHFYTNVKIAPSEIKLIHSIEAFPRKKKLRS